MEKSFQEITLMLYKELREGIVAKRFFKKPSPKVELEEPAKMSFREKEWLRRLRGSGKINELKLSIGKPKSEYGRSCGSRKEIRCFKCGKIGYIAQEC